MKQAKTILRGPNALKTKRLIFITSHVPAAYAYVNTKIKCNTKVFNRLSIKRNQQKHRIDIRFKYMHLFVFWQKYQ